MRFFHRRKTFEAGKALLVIAEDIEGEARNLLVLNRMHANMKVAAVKAPGFGDRRKAMLEDIAILTGATPIMEDNGIKLEELKVSDLGTAGNVTITKDNTTIVEGGGTGRDLMARVKQIEKEMANSTSDYDREKLQERLAKLVGGVAVLYVGAHTEVEMKEKKARVEDALNATRAAIEEGFVPGGGTALVRSLAAVKELDLSGDEALGAGVIYDSIQEPLRAIASNAGIDGSVVLHKVLASEEFFFGFNAKEEVYGNMEKMGVIDPTKGFVPHKCSVRIRHASYHRCSCCQQA